MTDHEAGLKLAARWIADSARPLVFTGAGLSTESGIPDFRSPGGIWEKYNPEDFYFDRFLASEGAREKYWQMATEMYEVMRGAQPNRAHLALARLERIGRLDCLITQNIDGLHQKAGTSEEKIIELHGTAVYVACLDCRRRFDRDLIQERIKGGVKVPYCDGCGGPLKPATISFGQAMPERELAEACRRSSRCDLFLVVGSSLVVYPAASLPSLAKGGGAKLAIINREPTPFDETADLVIRAEAGDALTGIVNLIAAMVP